MDFTQIIDIIKQVAALVEEAGLVEKFEAVAPILIEKLIELIKGFAA